jgi:membrane associated rhomboid family serine protease
MSTVSDGKGRSQAEAMIAEAKRALWVMVGLLAVIWGVQLLNALEGYDLSLEFGIEARNPFSLPDILTAPFVHASWSHIEANSGPLFIFGFLAAYRGVKKFLGVTLLIIGASGIAIWVMSAPNVVTVGASGLLFGYFGYIIVRGIFDRHLIDIVIGVVMALCFAYQLTALLPTQQAISWQGHLFGFIAGIAGGWLFRERRRKPDTATPTDPASILLQKNP